MPNVSDIQRGSRIRALVYGRFKTGKTAGAATWPRPNFLDFDQGLATLTNPDLDAKYKYSDRKIQFETFIERGVTNKGVLISHNALDDACRYFDECMKPSGGVWTSPRTGVKFPVGADTFDTWVIDSGTTLSQVSKVKALVLMGTSGMLIPGKKLSNTFDTAKSTGLILPKKQDFGAERSMVEQFVDMILGTDKHVLLLCHEREEWEGEGEAAHVTGIVPMFTGQSTETIPLKFDEVYNLQVKPEGPNWVRRLQTIPDSFRACGSRLGLPNGTPFEFDAVSKALNLKL